MRGAGGAQEGARVEIQTGEDESAAKIRRRDIADMRPTQTPAKLYGVLQCCDRGIVAQLAFIALERIVTDLRSAARKSIDHDQAGARGFGWLRDVVASKL